MPSVVQVCNLKCSLEAEADLHVDLTNKIRDDRFCFVWSLDAQGEEEFEEQKEEGTEQFRTLLRVKNFDDDADGAPDKVRCVVDTMLWCLQQLHTLQSNPVNEVVVRINCKSGQNRSAVVACRFAAVVWEGAPNAPGPVVYDMFRRLCKSEHPRMKLDDPKGTWPKFGVHGTGWAHAEIDGMAKRGENKYPENGPSVMYDETYPHVGLVTHAGVVDKTLEISSPVQGNATTSALECFSR